MSEEHLGSISLCGGNYYYMSAHNQVVNAATRDMFLGHGSHLKVRLKKIDIDADMLKKQITRLPQMIFEVTENCNLRCKYCVYNGHYKNQRGRSPRDMDIRTAKKGLDYIFSLVKGRRKKQFIIGFYGGEPLLMFKTLREIVAYGRELFSGWDLRFNMTTNLTLLEKEILDFLVENNISLLVSLDGGKNNHDAKRIFADNSGTHDSVLKNLEKIYREYPDYYSEKVGFSMVHSMDLSIKDTYAFFTCCDLVKERRVRFSTVTPYYTDYYEKYPFDVGAFREEYKQILARVLNKAGNEEVLWGFEKSLFDNVKRIGDSLQTRAYSSMAGACLFDSRLFIDTRGRFHMCERVNHSFPYGDVERGFDFERMADIAREFQSLIERNCRDCPVRFLCRVCYTAFAGDGKFKVNEDFCKDQKEALVKNIERYIKGKEEGQV